MRIVLLHYAEIIVNTKSKRSTWNVYLNTNLDLHFYISWNQIRSQMRSLKMLNSKNFCSNSHSSFFFLNEIAKLKLYGILRLAYFKNSSY